jgi:hypothetical protein
MYRPCKGPFTWLTNQILSFHHIKNLNLNTPSGPIYKRNFGQQKLMYLVKKLDQIHSLLLTQISLINRTGGSIHQLVHLILETKS